MRIYNTTQFLPVLTIRQLRKYFLMAGLFTVLLATQVSHAQTGKSVTDYYHLSTPVVFDKQAYHLVWTSHPVENFYKQEYLQRGDALPKFREMILIDVLTEVGNIKDVVKAKVEELKVIRETNPLVNYEILEHNVKGEYMLDFMIAQLSADGKTMQIVERNVYRYKPCVNKAGKKGVLLFGVSTRRYGKDVEPYIRSLKTTRSDLIQSVSTFQIPEVAVGD